MKLQAKLYDMINDTHQLAETSNLIANLSERARERLTRRKERKLERDEGDMMTVRDNRTGEVIATLKSHNPLLDPPLPASTHQKNYDGGRGGGGGGGGGLELFYGEPLNAAGFYHTSLHLPLAYPPLPYVTPPPSVNDEVSGAGGGAAAGDEAADPSDQHSVDPAAVVEKSKMNPNAKPFEVPKFQQQPPQQQSQQQQQQHQPQSTAVASTSATSTASSGSSYMIISQDFSTPVVGGVYVNANYASHGSNYASNPDLASSYAAVSSSLAYGTTPALPGGSGRDSGGNANRGGRQYRGAGSGRLHGGRGGGGGGGPHINGNR